MGYCVQTSLPAQEPIILAEMKNHLRLDPTFTEDDSAITSMISAAREHGELWTGRSLAQRTFRMVLDSAPYYSDAAQSQLAYPSSYYSLPLYSTTMWNYSQMIKLAWSPVISVQQLRYIDTNGNAQVLNQDTDFILDRISEPSRIFPNPATLQNWPPNFYVANSLELDYTAGYTQSSLTVDTHTVTATPPFQQPDLTIVTGMPHALKRLLMTIVSNWYEKRNDEIDDKINTRLQSYSVVDWAPTRG